MPIQSQAGILAGSLPPLARHLLFTLDDPGALPAALSALAKLTDGEASVVGIGPAVTQSLKITVDKLKPFPALSNAGIDVPSTQQALWLWLRGDDRGELLYRTMEFEQALKPAFKLVQLSECFRHLDGHDLSGYEDGTENPVGDEAVNVVSAAEAPYGSYAALQHWEHDLRHFKSLPQTEQDHIIGRRLSDNEEIEDAPESAHVKRTAMEDFEPEAFVVRRSMPYIDGQVAGLVFLAFGDSLRAFEVQLQRMIGLDDGIVDGLFRFSRPVSGGYYWCPPVRNGKLDLSALLQPAA
ncbi:MAG: Dyp-type peroxidase [Thauera sp.]|jgi:putative iron-dependent peroxidase|nr:Dyp-type peroxidase [Thauera sp.]